SRRTRRSNLLPADLSLTQSHRYLCSWGLTPLPPLSNSNYFGYIQLHRPDKQKPAEEGFMKR
ncbi:hypothetical protein D8T17_00905, partial [Salmonella enterica]|nr:hypothetical protein [Salmonella enterica]